MSSEPNLEVRFCGESFPITSSDDFLIGREGDLEVDDNPFLHRRFLRIRYADPIWLIDNIGSQLSATVSDAHGRLEAFLAPGATLPVVFEVTTVAFTAGPTSYELTVHHPDSPFGAGSAATECTDDGETTVGVTSLTSDQRLLLVALAEPRLRGDGTAKLALPSSQEAADRLGWTITKFNRKLDNVCQKLEKLGVRGLHGGPERLASSRRVRLVEHAVATRVVSRADLELLDQVRHASG